MESSPSVQTESASIESGIKALWDRVKHAAELIARLRSENTELRSQLHTLQEESATLKNQIAQSQQVINRLKAEGAEQQKQKGLALANGEQEALSARVKELLNRLEPYL